ncbi:hypothetical protein PJW07_23660, partial [Agrobacterium salinitolerans]|uniref:hypothetical protein n=1 Tax=Agrobacterium salinitolerans TaxID=1183413 RepID=UPI002300E9D6
MRWSPASARLPTDIRKAFVPVIAIWRPYIAEGPSSLTVKDGKPLKVVKLYDNFQISFYNHADITFLYFFEFGVLTCLMV